MRGEHRGERAHPVHEPFVGRGIVILVKVQGIGGARRVGAHSGGLGELGLLRLLRAPLLDDVVFDSVVADRRSKCCSDQACPIIPAR